MDMIDILGSLLGQKAGGGGAGADILKDIFAGARRQAPAPSGPSSAPGGGVSSSELDRQARELEDFFNVAKNRNAGSTSGQPQKPQLNPQPLPPQQPRSAEPAPRAPGWGTESQTQRRYDSPAGDAAEQQNLQAMILVKAMVNAAKCDGQISQAEQQQILSRLTNPSPEAIQFLRDEFSKPLDVREFAWSVPVGMEQSVYSMSLIAVDVDSAAEEGYLRDLARGLRLSPEICAQIKDRVTGGAFRMAAASSAR
jgi:uncharacterized membrane protein YebE (DUF533 family)